MASLRMPSFLRRRFRKRTGTNSDESILEDVMSYMNLKMFIRVCCVVLLYRWASWLYYGAKDWISPDWHLQNIESIRYPPSLLAPKSLPSDVKLDKCLTWNEKTYAHDLFHYDASFTLPTDAPELFVLQEGSVFPTTVHVEQHSATKANEAVIDVQLKVLSKDIAKMIEVCRASNTRGGKGFVLAGRFEAMPEMPYLKAEVHIRLPKHHSDILSIKKLSAQMDMSHIGFEDVDGVRFDEISTRLVDGNFIVHSLHAAKVDVIMSTPNPPSRIEGRFVSSEIFLEVTDGIIEVATDLQSIGGNEAKLVMKTHNSYGGQDSEISLTLNPPAEPPTTGGAASVDFNARYELGKEHKLLAGHMSPRARLNLTSRAGTGHNFVKMHEAFEGRFELVKANRLTSTNVQERKPKDPEGRGRKRKLVVEQKGGSVSGEVYWIEEGRKAEEGEGEKKGKIVIETGVGAAELSI